MGRMKDKLSEAPPTIGNYRRLGAKGFLVVCAPPCKRRVQVSLDDLRLADDTAFDIDATKSRFTCSSCGRRPAAVSIDWGVTAARPVDPRS